MFEFLAPIASGLRPLGDILGIAGAGASVANLFGLGRDRGTERAMRAQAQRAAELSEALANPNSPLARQMASEQMQLSRTERLAALRDLANQQMRSARRFPQGGGVTAAYATSPRRDEMIARLLTSEGQNEQVRAQQMARAQISQALGATAPAISTLGEELKRGAARRQDIISGLRGAGQFARGIAQEYGTQPSGAMVSPVAGTINEPTPGLPRNMGAFTIGNQFPRYPFERSR